MTMSDKGFYEAALFALDMDKAQTFHKGGMTNTTQRMVTEVLKLAPEI